MDGGKGLEGCWAGARVGERRSALLWARWSQADREDWAAGLRQRAGLVKGRRRTEENKGEQKQVRIQVTETKQVGIQRRRMGKGTRFFVAEALLSPSASSTDPALLAHRLRLAFPSLRHRMKKKKKKKRKKKKKKKKRGNKGNEEEEEKKPLDFEGNKCQNLTKLR